MHHILAFFASVRYHLECRGIWSEWSRGGKRRLDVAAVEFAGW